MKTRIIMKSGKQFNVYVPNMVARFCTSEKLFATYAIKIVQKIGVDYIIFGYCL